MEKTYPTVKVTICGIETEVNKYWYDWVNYVANASVWKYDPYNGRTVKGFDENIAEEMRNKYRVSMGLPV
jgi:hypothetical protein